MNGTLNRTVILGIMGTVTLGSMAASKPLPSAAVAHPVMLAPALDQEAVSALKSKIDPLLARGMDHLVGLVPERNGLASCGCPNCNQGSADNQIVWNGIADPDGARCRHCGHRYPSAQYPMNQVLSFTNRCGQPVQWHYYESADGKRHFFAARARYWRKWYVARLLEEISALYVATGDERYADAAAALLYRISQCYAGWVSVSRNAPCPDAVPPDPSERSIWHYWHYRDMEPSVAHAYDRLYDSGALERLSDRLGVDVKQAVEEDMLRASVTFACSFEETWGNASPILYRGLVLYGRVLNEPDFVHDGVRRAKTLLENNFLFDGMWRETTVSYHQMTIGGIKGAFDLAAGYSDPEGYRNPQDGQRFDAFDAMRQVPFFRKAVTVVQDLVFPNGRIVPVNDAWAKTETAPPPHNGPLLIPAMGHVRLGHGTGDNAMQAHLHFGISYGHRNCDNLSLILWSKGRELLADIGYTHSAWRLWTIRTAAHNTVQIDGWDQNPRPGGNLVLYAPLAGQVQVVEAEARAAYSDLVSDYRRRIFLIGISPADAYVVDIFRVAGGQQHEWILHGSADHAQTAQLSLATAPLRGTMLGPDATFRLPKSQTDTGVFTGPGIDSQPPGGKRWYRLRGVSYAFLQCSGKAETEEDWSVTFDYKDGSALHLRTTMLGQPGTSVYRLASPSIRPAEENDGELPKYLRPGVLVRRRGAANLGSCFTAVHEPYQEHRCVTSLDPLPVTAGGDPVGAVGLRISHAQGIDHILSRPVGQTGTMRVELREGSLICDGAAGFLRLHAGQVVEAALLGGTMLAYGDYVLNAPYAQISGRVLGLEAEPAAEHYALAVDQALPGAGLLPDSYVIIAHGDGTTHGYEVIDSTPQNGRCLLHLADDPGFRIDAKGRTRFSHYPGNTIEQPNTFRILSASRWHRDG